MYVRAFGFGVATRAAAFTVLLAGCGAEDLTGPPATDRAENVAAPPAAPATGVAPPAVDAAEAVAVAIEDAIQRVLPAVAEEASTTKLGSALARMADALEGGDREALSRAAERADEAGAELRDGFEDEIEVRVHLDVIGLVINRALSLSLPAEEPGPRTDTRDR